MKDDEWKEFAPIAAKTPLAWAVGRLGEALSSRDKADAIRHARSAEEAIHEFFARADELESFGPAEAAMSAAFHTWLRKADDSVLGACIYSAIAHDKGMRAYRAFIASLVSRPDQRDDYRAGVAFERAAEIGHSFEEPPEPCQDGSTLPRHQDTPGVPPQGAEALRGLRHEGPDRNRHGGFEA